MVNTVVTAFISFFSTNIDDILVLMLFFSQINNSMKKRHIVIGQYLGVGFLIVISILGGQILSTFSHEYIGLLGLVPIYLGIKTYIDYKEEPKDKELQEFESSEITIEKKHMLRFIKGVVNPTVIKVSSITFANGGDNIGIYIPLFASMSLVNVLITVIIFLFLIGVWCFIGLKLTESPFIQRNIEKYNHILVPIVFIALGIFIFIEGRTIEIIYR